MRSRVAESVLSNIAKRTSNVSSSHDDAPADASSVAECVALPASVSRYAMRDRR